MITHLQSLKAAAGFWAFGGTKDDMIYIPLPLYHSAASLIGIGGTIELGTPHNLSSYYFTRASYDSSLESLLCLEISFYFLVKKTLQVTSSGGVCQF